MLFRNRNLKTIIGIFTAVLILFSMFGTLRAVFARSADVFSPCAVRGLPTPVIDPGHGGSDGGAVSISGTLESGLNLEISLRLEQIFVLCGINCVMTRTSDEIEYPENAVTIRQQKAADQKNRVELVNSVANAVLISVHQNKYTTGQPFGAQVFFSKTEGSENFALLTQEKLKSVDPDNYRIAKNIPDSIYLLKAVDCPAILVECGFLSNTRDEALLKSREYQIKLAAAIVSSYFSAFAGGKEVLD